MTTVLRRSAALLLVGFAPLLAQKAEPPRIRPVAFHRHATLGMEVVHGEILLPTALPWPRVMPAPGETGIAQLQLVPPEGAGLSTQALQDREEDQRQTVEAEGYRVSEHPGLRRALQRYAQAHGGRGPAQLDEPEWLRIVAQGNDTTPPPPPPYPAGSPQQGRIDDLRRILVGHALVPRVPLDLQGAGKNFQPLLVELAPALDDGRHWVVDNRLVPSRQPVDARLLAQHGLKLSRERLPHRPAPTDPQKPVPFRLLALRRGQAPEARLQLVHPDGTTTELTWRFEGAAQAGSELLARWAQRRAYAWSQGVGDLSPLVPHFEAAQARVYGVKGSTPSAGPRRRDEAGGPTFLGLFGGRAAVDETLQLDRPLAGADPGAPGLGKVPVASLPGIPVASHPWKEMLGRDRLPVPALLDCVPLDRALLYLPRPRQVLDEFAGGGARFLTRVNALARQGALDHDLVARAQEDLALGSGLGRKLLEAGLIREAAVFLPDLALLSGTDLTLILEVEPSAVPLLAFAAGDTPRPVRTPRGEAWWARVGTRFFASTSRAELDRALALHRGGGAGSLGRTAELQVMLGKLAPTADTRAFVYFSDAFIRQLVGPGRRVQELRRNRARGLMEELAAAVELRRLDAPGAALAPGELRRLGYLREDFPLDGFTVAADGQVASSAWGPLTRLRPAGEPPVEVEAWEAQAYRAFREAYTQYWRRFFDPIALRLDARADGTYHLETFILPLLEHSAYRELRAFLGTTPAPVHQPRPVWARPMVAEMAFDVPWAKLSRGMLGRRGLGVPLPPELFHQLEPRLHAGFLDASPVVQMGGGSPFELMEAGRLGRGDQLMVVAPLLLGPFTRPMAMAIPVKNPEAARALLAGLGTEEGFTPRSRELAWRAHQAEDGRTILSLTFFGVVTLRWSLRVEGAWLVATNDTALPPALVAASESRPGSHGALTLRPGALSQGLAAAWQASVESDARAAWAAQRWLAPWLAAGLPLAEAQAASRRIFGAAPDLAGGLGPGPWPVNLRYGTPHRPRLPERKAGADFGLFEGVDTATVDMAFEEDGLRTRIHWTPAPGLR